MPQHVTISDITPRESFTIGSGGSSGPLALPSGFVVFEPSADLKVYDDGVQLSYVDPPVLPTQFKFNGSTGVDGGWQGGSIVLGGKATSGHVITVARDIPIERTTDFSYPSRTLDLEGLNTQLDKLFAIFQDREANQARALRQPVSDVAAIDYLPSSTGRAGKFLAFDSDGDPIASSGLSSVLVSSAMAPVVAAASLEAARNLLGVIRSGCVVMLRTADSGNDPSVTPATWVVYAPDGSVVDVTGTTTQGLQEAINHAQRYGYDLIVYGGATKPLKWGVAYGGALGADPFATANGSNIVTVTHASHGLSTGDKVTFNGLSGAINNIPASEFGPAGSPEKTITVIDANSYTITTTTNANATGSAGGANCRYQHAGQNPSIIDCTSTVTFKPMQLMTVRFHSITLNFGGGITLGIGFDSVMASSFEWLGGQVVMAEANATGIRFKPENELPQDPAGPVITSSRFLLPSVVVPVGGAGQCVQCDPSGGPVGDGNFFEIIEPNGGAAGFLVVDNATYPFHGNEIRVIDAHSQTSYCIQLGQSSTGATLRRSNRILLECDPATGGVGLDVWGERNKIAVIVRDEEGTPAVGLKLEASAKNNIIEAIDLAGTLPIQDLSDRSNRIIACEIAASVHRGGTNQTGIVTATWTKVQFTTEGFDAGAKFDNATNYRWTPGRVGFAQISANVAWTAAVDATTLAIAVYKNGGANRIEYVEASGTAGGQGPMINVLMSVDAITDYFEIFVRQSSGSDKDIDGTTTDTWAMFRMT